MKNAMQLKAVIKNISKETYLSTTCNAEFYAGAFTGANLCFEVSSELHIKRWFPDSGDGGLRYPDYYGYGCNN